MLATFTVGQIDIDTSIMVVPQGGTQPVHSLRSAIAAANDEVANPGHDIIIVPEEFANDSITLTLGSLNITSSMDILAPAGRTAFNKTRLSNAQAPDTENFGFLYNYDGPQTNGVELRGFFVSNFTSAVKVVSMPAGQSLLLNEMHFQNSKLLPNGDGGHGVDFSSNNELFVQDSTAQFNQGHGFYVHDTTTANLVAIIDGTSARGNGFAGMAFEDSNRPFAISGGTSTRDNGTALTGRGGIWIEDSSSPLFSLIGPEVNANGDSITEPHATRDNRGDGITIINSSFPELAIRRSFIGVGLFGQAEGNRDNGILLSGSTIGSITENVIINNFDDGIELVNSSVSPIQQNLIGTNMVDLSEGVQAGNGGNGILISGGIFPNQPTNDVFVFLNTIANNGRAGVALKGQADYNPIASNTFLNNAGLAIDLGLDGVTPNDLNDSDSGPNGLINTPVLDQDTVAFNQFTGQWEVQFSVITDTDGTYLLQLYRFDPVTKQYSPEGNFSAFVVQPDGTAAGTLPIPVGQEGIGNQYVALIIGNNGINANVRNNQDRTSEFSQPITLGSQLPPRVNGFTIRSPTQTFDYVPRVAIGQQYLPIAGTGLNAIDISFDQPVTIGDGTTTDGLAALTLRRDDGTTIAPTGFSINDNTATWTFGAAGPQSFLDGKYRLDLTAQEVLSVETGEALDGEYDAPISLPVFNGRLQPEFTGPGVELRSGQGAEGGDFRFHFAVNNSNTPLNATRLTGDYNDDEWVDRADYLVWRELYGANELPAFESQTRDFWWPDGNDDGLVNGSDYTIWRDNAGPDTITGVQGIWAADKPTSSSTAAFSTGPVVLFDQSPRVANLVISGSQSEHAPFSFDSIDGSGQQLATVPVGSADTISITFNEDVNVMQSDLQLVGLLTANTPELVAFNYDFGTMTAHWRFEGWALADHYSIRLADTVTDLDGNALDGEWVNPSSISSADASISTFPSGNGSPGGDFTFVTTILAGDTDGDGDVDYSDTYVYNYTMGSSGTHIDWGYGDFDGDGSVTQADMDIANANYGTALQSPIALLADLDGDLDVDADDLYQFYEDYDLQDTNGVTDADFDGDGDIDSDDLAIAFSQLGIDLHIGGGAI